MPQSLSWLESLASIILFAIFEFPCSFCLLPSQLCVPPSTVSFRGHEDLCDAFANSTKIAVWIEFTNWSWQLFSYEPLSFTTPSFPFVIHPPPLSPVIQTDRIITLPKFAPFPLLSSLEHASSWCCYSLLPSLTTLSHFGLCHPSSHIVWPLILIVHVPTPRSTVPPFPVQDIANTYLLCLCLF